MKPGGSKSLCLITLSIVTTVLVVRSGHLNVDYLEHLSPQVGFFLGVFSVLMTAAALALFGFSDPSRYHFRFADKSSAGDLETPLIEGKRLAILVGMNPRLQVRDLPMFTRKFLCFVSSFFVVLLCTNAQTTSLLYKVPDEVANGGLFCPTEQQTAAKNSDQPKAGCALIDRAFKLGLIRDRGSCGTSHQEEDLQLCTLRQRDEPLLHYSARLLENFISGAGSGWKHAPFWKKIADLFKERLQHITPLMGRLSHVVASTPGSTTHIFTNLGYPEGRMNDLWKRWFHKNQCLSGYRGLSYTGAYASDSNGNANNSQIFDRIFGQMLFDTQFDQSAGLCQEFTIHWNSPPDTCHQLAQNPEGFLKKAGLMGKIKEILDRYDDQFEITKLQVRLTSIATGLPPPLPPTPSEATAIIQRLHAEPFPETILSFDCFIETQGSASPRPVTETPFKIFGHVLQAREVQFPDEAYARQTHLDIYKYLATAMVDAPGADIPLVKTTKKSVPWQPGPEYFTADYFPLSSLEYLKETDVFSGTPWLQSRDDLLQLYPYYYRLGAFIKAFRDDYRSRWTRL